MDGRWVGRWVEGVKHSAGLRQRSLPHLTKVTPIALIFNRQGR